MTQSQSNENANINRREALSLALGTFGMAALGPVGRAVAATSSSGSPPPQQPFLVIVELEGGNDWLNTVVPHTLPNYAAQRPSLGFDPSATLAIDTGPYATVDYRLHPNLTELAAMYAAGEVAIVQKVGYEDANKSHDVSKRIWAQGVQAGLGASGWIARYAEREAPTSLGAVSIACGRHRSFAGGSVDPLSVGSLQAFRFDADSRYNNNHQHRMDVIRSMLESRTSSASRDALLAGHSLAGQIQDAVNDYTSTVTYRTGSLSNRLIDVARMIQAGFETRIFYTRLGGFDTHGAQAGRHVSLLQALDEGLKDLTDDLKAMGVWNQTAILVMSEFGRRNFENGSGGTDHGEAGNVLLLGGRIQGGLHGPTLTNSDIGEDNLEYGMDFRAVYSHILQAHLGVSDPTTVFSAPLAISTQPNLFL